jgi:LysM repeat protein
MPGFCAGITGVAPCSWRVLHMRISPSQQTKCAECGAALMPTDQTCWVCGAANAGFRAAQPKAAREKAPDNRVAETSAAEAIIDAATPGEPEADAAKPQPAAAKVAVPRRAKVTLTRIAEEAAEAQRAAASDAGPRPTGAGPVRARPAAPFKPTKLKGAPRYIGAKPAPSVPPILIVVPFAAVIVIAALAITLLNRPEPEAVQSAALVLPTNTAAATSESAPVLPIVGTAEPLPTLPPTPAVTLIVPSPTTELATAMPTQIAADTPVPPTPIPTLAATQAPTAAPTAAATATTVAAQTYTVVPGDTCGKISKQFGITVESIITTNALAANCPLSVDQKLILPVGTAAAAGTTITPTLAAPTATVAPTETPLAAGVSGASGAGGTYTIKPGDSCFVIAKANGISVEALIAANGLDSRCLLRAGATLIIPKP